MTVTYTSAIDRDSSRTTEHARRFRTGHLLLAATSLLAVLAIGLAYSGRLRAVSSAPPRSASPTNLNTVVDRKELEPPLGLVFTNPEDRRFAAQRLLQFILSLRGADGGVPNVGAIAGATVPVEAIRRAPGLVDYQARLREADDRAARAGASPPTVLPLFESGDVALLKPWLVVRTPTTFARAMWRWSALYVAAFWAVALFWWVRAFRGDYVLLASAHLLTAIGFAALLGRPDPFRDTLLFVRYTQGVVLGLACFSAMSVVDFRKARFLTLSYVPLIGALCLCLLLIAFGDGPGRSSAKVNLGPIQPIEAIRLLLALFLAGYFTRRWELLRQIPERAIRNYRVPAWLNLPRLDYVLPVLLGVGAALLLFFLQQDLGPALFLSCVFLATYAIARNRTAMAIVGLVILLAGFYVGYQLNVSSTLAARVHMWQSPWDNGVAGGDHVAQAVWAMSTGGLLGTGLGLGETRHVSAGHTDLVLAAIGEELGFLGLLLAAIAFAVIAARGFRAGLRAPSDYGFFLATTVTLFLVLPVLVMPAGMLGIVPLTGVVSPFLSYGGSAMVANFAALGMLVAIGAGAGHTAATEPFRAPTRVLVGVLACAAIALLSVLFDRQVLRGDQYLVKPYLGLQADGVRRYQHNPRVLNVIGLIPRGTVFDRRNLPLATGDAAVARRAHGDYGKYGIDVDSTCTAPIERCYPLGGAAFHLLGDARSRRNWTASNTAYVERDAEHVLRGFDDRRELIPLLRHRHDVDNGDVRAILNRNRDVHLTIDARLQARIAKILKKYASRSATGHASAVVLDPDTGDLLAVSSYPFPTLLDEESGEGDESDTLLDRARFGLYPPGSTFKLVTAVAALRTDITSSGTTFTCALLPGGRVGTRIPGWSRPVRDDVLDTRPHGTIDMRGGLVHSCNAYFAQLAVRLGPSALLDTAMRLGITVAPANSAARLHETLPQAGYGQGDVVATPLRMARLAAAIADNGVLREPRLVRLKPDTTSARADVLMKPDAAATLGRYLRDAVLNGTGGSLSHHSGRIAGKTGTAEVNGAPSHAWFVGFAPYGPAKKRIAFAIIIENAGYGGLAAAPVAGDIVTAATGLGLIR